MEAISTYTLVMLFSGLALFLYGMNTMSDGLEAAASSKLRKIVELFTINPVVGVLVGAFVTTIVQSSSATTVMVVGFVNAGIMNLYQAIGIIMGANIGTTITAQMVSFKLTAIAPYSIIIGVSLMFFTKNVLIKKYAQIILGFGLLFMGMEQMSNSMKVLRDVPEFKNIIETLSEAGIVNTLLLLLIGVIFTGIVQSSSATTALLVTMVSEGTISVSAAFPMVMGANIGTTITALLSSIGASKAAVKAAIIHLIFNVIGVSIFTILFIVFRDNAVPIINSLGNAPTRQIANAHTIFNITNTILIFPFSNHLVNFVNKIIPDGDIKESERRLDDRMLQAPTFAIEATKNEIVRMGEVVIYSYKNSIEALIENNEKKALITFETEKSINEMEKYIGDFLIKLSNTTLSPDEHLFIDNMFNIINDIERIGDHADNVAELAKTTIERGLFFSTNSLDEMKYMSDRVLKSIVQGIESLKNNDIELAKSIIKREDEIDLLEKEYRKEHIKRLNEGLCTIETGVLFLDLLSNLERIGDHAKNIAYYVREGK